MSILNSLQVYDSFGATAKLLLHSSGRSLCLTVLSTPFFSYRNSEDFTSGKDRVSGHARAAHNLQVPTAA